MAPAEAVGSLELCIQGLEPGRCYIGCVHSVARDGIVSSASAWSPWLTLPVVLQPFELLPCGNMSRPCLPHLIPQPVTSPHSLLLKTHEVSLEKTEKQMGVIGAESAPEVTGQEEMMLYLD